MGVSGTLLESLAIVDNGDALGPHLAIPDWRGGQSELSLCGRRILGVAKRGFEAGCPVCAGKALGAGITAVQGHDGVFVNVARVLRRTGRRRSIPYQSTR